MRSKFTDLLLVLHVDKQPLEPLRVPALTRVWDAVNIGENDMPIKDKVPEMLSILKNFVRDYLTSSRGLQKSYEKDKNSMTLSILRLAKNLIIFGFYRTQSELIEMIDPLITLLDGSHDVTTEEEEIIMRENNALESLAPDNAGNILGPKPGFVRFKTRYEMTESNLTVMKCKNEMCEILSIVMDIQNDIRITRFLREFNERLVNGRSSIDIINPINTSKRKVPNFELDTASGRIRKSFEVILSDKSLDLEELSWADFVCINLDLILYQNESLLNKAFSLLVRFHSQRKNLLSLLRSIQMLESNTAIQTLKEIEGKLAELRGMAQNSEFWIGRNDQDAIKTSKKTFDIINYLSELLIKEDHDDVQDEEDIWAMKRKDNPFLEPEQEENTESQSNKASHKKQKLDQDLASFVEEEFDDHRPLPIDSEKTNPEYQKMMCNLLAHEIVLTIVKQNSMRETENEKLYKKVIKSSYSFLIRFVRNNKTNKRMLAPYIDTVFKEHGGSGLGATQLVGEIMRDNSALLNKGYTDLSEKVDLIELTPLSSLQKATRLYYLSVYMKVKDENNTDNQLAIISELTDQDNKNTIYLFNSEQRRQDLRGMVSDTKNIIFKELAKRKEIEVELSPELSYTTQLLHVLSVACFKNEITKVICQRLFKLDEMIESYKEADFLYIYKIAVVQFLIDAYLEIEKDVSTDFQNSLLDFFEVFADELETYMSKGSMAYLEGGNLKVGDSQESQITVRSLFGKYLMSKIQKVFIFETLMTCLDHAFQLRMRITKQEEPVIMKLYIQLDNLYK